MPKPSTNRLNNIDAPDVSPVTCVAKTGPGSTVKFKVAAMLGFNKPGTPGSVGKLRYLNRSW